MFNDVLAKIMCGRIGPTQPASLPKFKVGDTVEIDQRDLGIDPERFTVLKVAFNQDICEYVYNLKSQHPYGNDLIGAPEKICEFIPKYPTHRSFEEVQKILFEEIYQATYVTMRSPWLLHAAGEEFQKNESLGLKWDVPTISAITMHLLLGYAYEVQYDI